MHVPKRRSLFPNRNLFLAACGPIVALAGCLERTADAAKLEAGSSGSPSSEQIAFAMEASDLMTNTVVAALLQEIGETTPDNVPHGNLSISLIFDDKNKNMRLVGDLEPLSDNDYPIDSFEASALADALQGFARTTVEGWTLRRSIPLSTFVQECAMCHVNYAEMPVSTYVGALMLRVPVPKHLTMD